MPRKHKRKKLMMAQDENGVPIVALPPPKSLGKQLFLLLIVHVLFPLLVPVFVLPRLVKGEIAWKNILDLSRVVNAAHSDPIDKLSVYQDPNLLKKVWSLPSAKVYRNHGSTLEYQKREGYCAGATRRCILKSFSKFPSYLVPPQEEGGESNPDKWRASIEKLAQENNNKDIVPDIHVEVVRGDVSFPEFLKTLEKVNDENTRVAVNYLRPALFGFKRPRWFPGHLTLGLLGGHFSPIVGILKNEDDDPLVAVFDVNHKYGGTYLVPASRLYESVKALDLSTRQSRALIVLEMP
jgi:hypothetical protein